MFPLRNTKRVTFNYKRCHCFFRVYVEVLRKREIKPKNGRSQDVMAKRKSKNF